MQVQTKIAKFKRGHRRFGGGELNFREFIRVGFFPPKSDGLLLSLKCQGRWGAWGEETYGETPGDAVLLT